MGMEQNLGEDTLRGECKQRSPANPAASNKRMQRRPRDKSYMLQSARLAAPLMRIVRPTDAKRLGCATMQVKQMIYGKIWSR